MKRNVVLILTILASLAAGCDSSPKTESALHVQSSPAATQPIPVKTESFDEQKAVLSVLKDHPGFPEAGGTQDIEIMTGGKSPGTRVKGTLTTTVEKSPEPNTYIVTLAKQWDFTFSGKELTGHWTYKATPETVQLIESEDNTDLIKLVK